MNVQLSILNTIFIERKGSRDLGEKFSEKLSWISKKHVKLQINGVYPFFNFLHTHWSSNIIRRNVTLWDERIMVYNDTQIGYGNSLLTIFPQNYIQNFHKKKIDFNSLSTTTSHSQRKKEKNIRQNKQKKSMNKKIKDITVKKEIPKNIFVNQKKIYVWKIYKKTYTFDAVSSFSYEKKRRGFTKKKIKKKTRES